MASVETQFDQVNALTQPTMAGSVIEMIRPIIKDDDMDEDEVDINIECVDDNKVSIKFKDNGKGIPKHLLKRILDPFVTTKRGQSGSGLGMHLVYNLVTQALSGAITLVSEEGHGVQFAIVFLPKRLKLIKRKGIFSYDFFICAILER
jgi:nitrogen fixation/metabolism regulation signal transduction histidine kinase